MLLPRPSAGAAERIRHSQRRADGRFIALRNREPQPEGDATPHRRLRHLSRRRSRSASATAIDSASLDLPSLEDAVSIQLALIDVAQALAANRIDTKRAGLLLYALQVASANVQKMHIPLNSVRSVTYTDDGAPLAPQDYGYDVEDYDDEDEEELDEDTDE